MIRTADDQCIGYGDREGICDNKATVGPAHFWCEDCEHERRVAITEQMAVITDLFVQDDR